MHDRLESKVSYPKITSISRTAPRQAFKSGWRLYTNTTDTRSPSAGRPDRRVLSPVAKPRAARPLKLSLFEGLLRRSPKRMSPADPGRRASPSSTRWSTRAFHSFHAFGPKPRGAERRHSFAQGCRSTQVSPPGACHHARNRTGRKRVAPSEKASTGGALVHHHKGPQGLPTIAPAGRVPPVIFGYPGKHR